MKKPIFESRSYKLSVNEKMKEFSLELIRFYANLDTLIHQNDLLENETFLKTLATCILELNRHSEELREMGIWIDKTKLLHHVLKTPMGAPFVANSTFLKSADLYSDEIPLKSTLHDLLEQIVFYSRRLKKIPLLETLKFLKET